MLDALKLIRGVGESLGVKSPYYQKQIDAQTVPGFADAVMVLTGKAVGIQDAVVLGVRLGVYLEIKNEEARRLQKMMES